MSENSTAVATVDTANPRGIVSYSSITSGDKASKVMVYNAVTNAESLGDILGKTLTISNVVITPAPLENEETGEVEVQPRVTLIDAEGNGYYATSTGIYDGVLQLFSIFGHPGADNADWPLSLYIEQIKTSKGYRMFQIRLVTDK